MKDVRETPAQRDRALRLSALGSAVALALACGSTAHAVGFSSESGDFYGSWDTTLSYGQSWRMERASPGQVGIANGGEAFSVNNDDGTLNFQRGKPTSRTAKITSELELNYKNFGGFFRAFYFYDMELMNDERQRTQLPSTTLDRVGSYGDLLDAFVWYRFDIGNMPAEIRVGEQVINWGESTFIQGGINVINHINVSAIRVPGAELREALLPQDLVSFSLGTSENTSLEFVYQYDWDNTEPDYVGTFFGVNDFVPADGRAVRLGFGDTPDVPNPEFSNPNHAFNAIPRIYGDLGGDPPDDDQYGVAFRWFLPNFNNGTEIGLYYYKYHSRLPLISARTGTFEGLQIAAGIGADGGGAAEIAAAAGAEFAMSGDRDAALAAGAAAANGLVPEYAALGIADAAITGGNVALIGGAYATDAFANTPDANGDTAAYFTTFPEDIEMVGVSFNTTVGTWAWQGEYSMQINKPLQIDDLELLFAGLSSLRDPFAAEGQLGSFSFNSISPQFNPDTPPLTRINGFRRFNSSQLQATATKLFGPIFGATQGAFLFEGAITHVHKFPDKDELRFNGPATWVSGNAALADLAHPGKPVLPADRFADATSYGYRMAGFLDYNNAIGSINLQPRFSWQHDLHGISPGPAGNFIEGRKALTLGVRATYQQQWEGNLSYTTFWGAGDANQLNDRDFLSWNLKYNF
ncbi:MAG: DUF1302 domain-containing protein [Pseudomonadota bacterium]